MEITQSTILPMVAVQLGMRATAFLQDGLPPVLVCASEYTGPAVAEARREQVENRDGYHRYLLDHQWRRYDGDRAPATDHDWDMTLLMSTTSANIMVGRGGIPLLFSGVLFNEIREQELGWLSAAASYGCALVYYCLDAGALPDSKELERRLNAGRAYFIQVPVMTVASAALN